MHSREIGIGVDVGTAKGAHNNVDAFFYIELSWLGAGDTQGNEITQTMVVCVYVYVREML